MARHAASAETICPAAQIDVGTSICYLLPPDDTGAAGENANVPSYVLTPSTRVTDREMLVLFLNGSGGHPAGQIADATNNFYLAAATSGYHVIALSYASNGTIAGDCGKVDSCYFATRQTLILGVYQPDAASVFSQIGVSEGIADRLVLALTYLSAAHPDQDWDQFLTAANAAAPPEDQIEWRRIVVAGHSQGGGHAAAIGKLFPVARVIELSATCDEVGGEPASWLVSPGQTDPSLFWGLGSRTTFTGGIPTGGDTLCPTHLASWHQEGMPASHQNDDAQTCGATGDTHNVTIFCADNYANWQMMLGPVPCEGSSKTPCVTPLISAGPAALSGRN